MTGYTAPSVFWMYVLMFVFAAGALLILYMAVRRGAVADSEAPKYRMMEDDLPLASPAASPEGGGNHGQ